MGEETTKESQVGEFDLEESRMSGSLAIVLVTTIVVIAFLLNLQINTTVTTDEALKNFQSACSVQSGQYTLSTLPASAEPVDKSLEGRVTLVHTCRVAGEVVATLRG